MKWLFLISIFGLWENAEAVLPHCAIRVSSQHLYSEEGHRRRREYVLSFMHAGFEEPSQRPWEKTMPRRPYWITQNSDESDVVLNYAAFFHSNFSDLETIVTSHTNFFHLTLELERLVREHEGVNLRLFISPSTDFDSLSFQMFLERVCELMRRGQLMMVIQEDSSSAFDTELPAHFIQPAA